MATYVNDLRLKEIATGDESGTWGTSTNTNLSLIADAFSYATKDCFATDADATETMADGSADEIRSLYLKVTSSATLTATRTLTIAPNTVSKVWIIENATTGSQSISISQGSGANVTIPNGDVKVIYTDGGGATAAVTDAFANLKVTDPAQTNITSVGTLTGLTVNGDATFTGASYNAVWDSSDNALEFADNAKAIFGAGSDLQIYHDGSNSFIAESGTGNLQIQAQNLSLEDSAGTRFLLGIQGGETRLYNQGNQKVAVTSTGIDVTGTVTSDGLTVDTNTLYVDSTNDRVGIGTTSPAEELHISSGSPVIRLEDTDGGYSGISGSSGNVRLRADEGNTEASSFINFEIDTTEEMRLTSTGLGIGTSSPAAQLELSSATGATLRLSRDDTTVVGPNSIGSIEFYTDDSDSAGVAASVDGVADGSGGNVALAFSSGTGGSATERMRIDSSGNVGIGTSSPDTLLHLNSTTGAVLKLARQDGSVVSGDSLGKVEFYTNDATNTGVAGYIDVQAEGGAAGGAMLFGTGTAGSASEQVRIAANGNVGIGTSSPTTVDGGVSLQIEGSTGSEVIIGNSTTTVTAGDFFGGIAFKSADANASPPHYSGIKAKAEDTFGNAGLQFYSGRDRYEAGTSPNMVILGNTTSTDGYVGIGTSSPSTALDVSGTVTATYIAASNSVFDGSGGIGAHALKTTYSGSDTFKVQNTGNVTISGALSKGSGSFRIDHPLESKKDTHELVHSFVEAPQADLIYRGKVDLVDGSATVNIDTVAGMTEGTFVVLNREVQCFTSNESDWDAVKGSVSGNILTIECQNTSSTATVSWLVIGERQDQHMYDTDWTDDNGKVIVEPLKGE